MIEILEFDVKFNHEINTITRDDLFVEFIAFIESYSVFYGGGDSPLYIRGVLYCDNEIDFYLFIDDLILFFLTNNISEIINIGLNIEIFDFNKIENFANKYNKSKVNFYLWDIHDIL